MPTRLTLDALSQMEHLDTIPGQRGVSEKPPDLSVFHSASGVSACHGRAAQARLLLVWARRRYHRWPAATISAIATTSA
jgi:hypothetical protein